jgi:hypothetical protein
MYKTQCKILLMISEKQGMVDKFEANPNFFHTLLKSWKTPRHMK